MERADIAIIGTGPGGVSAALTANVRNKNILLIGKKQMSDKVSKAHQIMNYPGLPAVTGADMAKAFEKQLAMMEIDITDSRIGTVYAMGDYFAIQAGGEVLEAKSVILACGVVSGKTLPGEEEMLGRGVSYCATCDACFYKGKKVCGILTEAVTDFESGNIEFVVVGMGLNLYLDQENLPGELRNIAGALYETKEDAEQTDRNKLTATIVNELRKETADLKLSPDYVTHNMIPGHQITITDGNSSRQAFALEICRDGRLKVREEDGQETILSFGEVSVSM